MGRGRKWRGSRREEFDLMGVVDYRLAAAAAEAPKGSKFWVLPVGRGAGEGEPPPPLLSLSLSFPPTISSLWMDGKGRAAT